MLRVCLAFFCVEFETFVVIVKVRLPIAYLLVLSVLWLVMCLWFFMLLFDFCIIISLTIFVNKSVDLFRTLNILIRTFFCLTFFSVLASLWSFGTHLLFFLLTAFSFPNSITPLLSLILSYFTLFELDVMTPNNSSKRIVESACWTRLSHINSKLVKDAVHRFIRIRNLDQYFFASYIPNQVWLGKFPST